MKRSIYAVLWISILACLLGSEGKADYHVLWTGDLYFPVDGIPQSYIGDVDGDNRLEMVGREGTATVIVDAMTGANEYNGGPYSLGSSYAMVDLDNDGTPEVIGQSVDETFVIDWVIAANQGESGQDLDGPASFSSRPNPFETNTNLSFALGSESVVDIAVYDVAGRQVRRLESGLLPSGQHSVAWNGRDDGGRPLSAGTYFYEIKADGRSIGKAKTIRLN